MVKCASATAQDAADVRVICAPVLAAGIFESGASTGGARGSSDDADRRRPILDRPARRRGGHARRGRARSRAHRAHLPAQEGPRSIQSIIVATSALSASHQTSASPPRRFARVLTDPSPFLRRVCSAAVNEAAISADPSRSPSTARRSSSPRGATSCAGACPTATSGAGERRAAATPSQGPSPPTPSPSRPRRAGSWCW